MKNISLRWRITLLTGLVLLICSTALTIAASVNADKQFSNIAFTQFVPESAQTTLPATSSPALEYDGISNQGSLAAEVTLLAEAKEQFDAVGILALLLISVLGMGAVYWMTGHALKPVSQLSEQVEAITQNNLSAPISEVERTDEIGALCRSFNTMLDRLDSAFTQQKQFSAHVAHELKTPLATMYANIQVLQLDEHPSPEGCKKMLDTVARNTNRLKEIVDHLMLLCNEQIDLKTEAVDLQKTVVSILDELAPAIAQKQITTQLNCGLQEVQGNSELLYRAFFNLIENAVKYNHSGGSICISSAQEGAVGQIELSDTGIGISPDALPHIFEPFYRVDQSRSKKISGSGLGLSVVQRIMERCGWSISVNSEVGEGTTFILRFYLN